MEYFFLFFILLYGAAILISIAMAVLQIIAYWKLFEKAGEPGWAAIVPVYSFFVMFKIATGKMTLGWIYLVTCVGYVVAVAVLSFLSVFVTEGSLESDILALAFMGVVLIFVIAMYGIMGYNSYMLTKAYGKDTLLCILSIFFRNIIMIVIGFDKNTVYSGPLVRNVEYNNYS